MDFIARFGISVTLTRRTIFETPEEQADAEHSGEGLYQDPEQITAVYDPVFSDLGRDSPERRTGTVLTYETVALKDLIEDQEVTQVMPRYHKNGTFHYNEVSL